MKTPSLERFYLEINKSILLLQSYTEIRELPLIIKSCRLKPHAIFFKKEKYNLKLYRCWFDEFGNSLNIIKNKKIKLIYNELSLCDKKNMCTDIYYGLSIEKIIKLSKIFHLMIDDEDNKNYQYTITFLGIDNYLRSYIYDYNQWKQISPLFLGIKRLINIFNYADIKYFHELSNKKKYVKTCEHTTEWISCLPTPEIFLDTLKKKHNVDFSFLRSEIGLNI